MRKAESLTGEIMRELQTVIRSIPTLIVGSGHSCAYGLPSMEDIANYLLSELPQLLSESDSIRLWKRISKSIAKDFEEGLNGLSASDKGVDELLHAMRRLITVLFRERCSASECCFLSEGLFENPNKVGLLRLMKMVYRGCSPNTAGIDIITTNYDTLMELFCDAAGLPVQTGFQGHRFRGFAPATFVNPIYSQRTVSEKGRVKRDYNIVRSVRILKPHGSVNWVIDRGRPVEMLAYGDSDESTIIVPGPFKYKDALVNSVFDEIRMIMNDVLKSTPAVVAIGFGFNDEHLQSVIKDRLNLGMPMIILTKEWTKSIENMIDSYKSIIAFEQNGEGAMCAWKGKRFRVNTPVWELDSFLKLVIE
ncbi:MAG: SIR2 family protein [Desulfobacteraceae bacterium]|nr:SIR2 family protein [Desulfobacteraceae bacterium]